MIMLLKFALRPVTGRCKEWAQSVGSKMHAQHHGWVVCRYAKSSNAEEKLTCAQVVSRRGSEDPVLPDNNVRQVMQPVPSARGWFNTLSDACSPNEARQCSFLVKPFAVFNRR